jgi:membrane-bound lytic murein transglycosylase D
LAALDVSSHPGHYFKGLDRHEPEDRRIVELPAYFPVGELSTRLDVDREDLKSLNPALGSAVWIGSKYIPKGYGLRLPSEVSADSARERLQRIAASAGHAKQQPDLHYRVKRGDTLSEIAARYDSDVSVLMEMNDLASSARIRAGQELRLPVTPAP